MVVVMHFEYDLTKLHSSEISNVSLIITSLIHFLAYHDITNDDKLRIDGDRTNIKRFFFLF